MLSSNGNPYLRPEYLNPPPSTQMDSKKSPLALLAQTCSQIGSDPVSTPAGSSSSSAKIPERKKSMESPPINGQQQSNNKSSPILSVGGSMDLSNKGRSSSASVEADPAAKAAKKESRNNKETSSESRRSKSSSPKDRPRPGSELPPTSTPTSAAAAAPSAASIPAYNPLMMPTSSDPMAGYKSLMAAGISPYPSPYYPGYPSGLDLNAYASALKAMPPPPPSAYHPHHHPHPAAAAAAYSAALALQYSRMNAAAAAAAAGLNKPTGAEPCRDPYCTGCPNSSPSIHMICPAGCSPLAQCDHPKVPIPAGPPSTSSSTAPPPQNSKPYVCNWIVADNYCGKRFGSSDDLLQHLRTHTNLTSSTSSVDTSPAHHPRAYPTPPLSPLSAARYHPYGKHPSNGVAAPPPPPTSFFPQGGYNPALFQHPALAPYYSHLSLFAPPRASLPP